MESINAFNGGMYSDVSKHFQGKNTYIKAVNLRPFTEMGQSNGSLVTIKGNECSIGLPMLQKVFKFSLNTSSESATTLYFTINNIDSDPIIINSSTTTKDVYNTLKTMPNCYQTTGVAFPYSNFALSYSEDYVVIYQNPEYTGCGAGSSALTVKVTTTITGTNNYLIFYNYNGNNQNAPVNPQPYINSVNTNLAIIGSTYINEAIYLFTCPTVNPNNLGQIWEMTYNEASNIVTIKLLYNGYISLSTQYTIPQTAAVGRYEIDSIQRIYWTDFNNPVRTCNVKDVALMTYTDDILNLKPNVSGDVPILSGWGDGGNVVNLDSGISLQCAYRLKKNNGAITNYSALSNIVYVVDQTIAYQINASYFNSLQGNISNSTVPKTYTWTVNNVDTDFDLIEFIIVKRSPTSGNYEIYKYDEKVINGNPVQTSTFVNDINTMEQITLEEFLLDTIFFDTCKTIETKDNRLFFGNVKSSTIQVLEDFDTRAFRFEGLSHRIRVLNMDSDNVNTPYDLSTQTYDDIPLDADNVPVYNIGFEIGDDPRYSPFYKYMRNSQEIGGEGPNIKFRFGTQLLRVDQKANEPNKGAGDFNTGTAADNTGITVAQGGFFDGYRLPGNSESIYSYVFNTNPTNLDTQGHIYPAHNTKQTMGYECFGGLFKSYMLNEIYRFAIVFKTKYGQAYFAKHIADIKFPNYDDVNSNGGSTFFWTAPDFRSIHLEGPSAYANIPYIEFEVNIPQAVADVIDGWEIVRVKREEKDRVVKGHGLINQCTYGPSGSNDDLYLPIPYGGYNYGSNILNPYTYPANTGSATAEASPYALTYHCFDFLVDQGANNPYTAGDRLYVTEVYNANITGACQPSPTFIGSANMYYISKFYSLSMNGFRRYNVAGISYVGLGDSSVATPITSWGVGASTTYHNYDIDTTNSPNFNTNTSHSLGCPTHLIGLGAGTTISWAGTISSNPLSSTQMPYNRKALAQYIKPGRLQNQYGGRTYMARANSEYISTGALQKVTTAGVQTAKVFGGDIYHGVMDIQKAVKNWNQTGRPVTNDGLKSSQTFFFPTQGVRNVDLRVGSHINKDLDNDGGSNASGYDEYGHYDCYTFENELRKYYPKPIFFNETDKWVNRVYYSDVKINGENSDSWTSIQANNFYDVEGNYGQIHSLIALRNNMYYVQDRAFGVLNINPVSMVSDQNGLPLLLGTGNVIQKHNYISIDYGTKHQWSVSRSQNAIAFVDIRNKKALLFDGSSLQAISDLRGNRNYFIKKLGGASVILNDNPILGKGIITTYDYYHDEFLFTTLDTRQEVVNQGGEPIDVEVKDYSTIAFSGITNNFTGLYSFAPNIYINNNSRLFSTNGFTNTKLYMHNIGNYNTFYGTTYKSYLQISVNDNPTKTKVFDNISWITESIKDGNLRLDEFTNVNPIANYSDNQLFATDTFQRMRCYNEYQNTDWVPLSFTNPIDNLRKTEQGWTTFVPRNKVDYDVFNNNAISIFNPQVLTKDTWGERLRDKFMMVELEYDNVNNTRFIVHNLTTTYRISDR